MSVVLLISYVVPSMEMAIDAMALIRECVCARTYKSQTKILKDFRDELWTQKYMVNTKNSSKQEIFKLM